MERKITSLLPTPSLILITLCVAGILGFLFLIIVPDHIAAKDLDSKISAKETQLKTQELLSPLYHQLQEMLKSPSQIDNTDLPFPEKTKLDQKDIDQIQSTMEAIIRENRLEVEQIEPDVSTIIDDSGRLKMHISVTGEFVNFRSFILRLGEKFPSIEHIERIQIQRVKDTKHLRLGLEIWIAQK